MLKTAATFENVNRQLEASTDHCDEGACVSDCYLETLCIRQRGWKGIDRQTGTGGERTP